MKARISFKNNSFILIYTSLLSVFSVSCQQRITSSRTSVEKSDTLIEKTAFQTSSPWMSEIDVRSDIAIVYGTNGNPSDNSKKTTFEERVKSWKDHGYKTHFMTGIAWGAYEDYFLGEWDGKNHLGEGQVQMNGDTIWHGRNIPYIVPVDSFIEYMKKEVVKRVIDAGISSIYFEEPEFWARAG